MSNIYIINHPAGFVKVGRSKKPFKRYKQIQTASPFQLELYAVFVIKGDVGGVESYAHETLEQYNKQGEWFTIPPEVAQEYITETIEASDAELHETHRIRCNSTEDAHAVLNKMEQAEFAPASEM